jgi:hypothetical protein
MEGSYRQQKQGVKFIFYYSVLQGSFSTVLELIQFFCNVGLHTKTCQRKSMSLQYFKVKQGPVQYYATFLLL